MRKFFNRLLNPNPGITRFEAEEKGYKIVRVDLHKKFADAYTMDFEIGEEVIYLGHEGVGGWWYGNKHIADEELVSKTRAGGCMHFYKKVNWVNHKITKK